MSLLAPAKRNTFNWAKIHLIRLNKSVPFSPWWRYQWEAIHLHSLQVERQSQFIMPFDVSNHRNLKQLKIFFSNTTKNSWYGTSRHSHDHGPTTEQRLTNNPMPYHFNSFGFNLIFFIMFDCYLILVLTIYCFYTVLPNM